MSETQPDYLETFPHWLGDLGEDAVALGALLSNEAFPEPCRAAIAGGLNYLFKSLDLIPDGIDDIGFLDDAFVLRVAARLAWDEGSLDLDDASLSVLKRLSHESDIVQNFLEDDYPRFETYVRALRKGAARGRGVDEILADDEIRRAFLEDLSGFVEEYRAPTFSREEKNLIKLRAFFDAKLPR